MPVPATTPKRIPETVYDQWTIDTITIQTDRASGRQSIRTRFVMCRELPDKSLEYDPAGEGFEMVEPFLDEIPSKYPAVAQDIADISPKLGRACFTVAALQGLL